MQLLDVGLFFGRFHPLLVHLPIGILLLALLFSVLSFNEKYIQLRKSLNVILFVGFISSVLACVTGYLLSIDGEYKEDTVGIHMWLAIATTFISFTAYLLHRKLDFLSNEKTKKVWISACLLLFIGITLTGHYGATLTHGSGYLSTDDLFDKVTEKKKLADINQALVFEDLILPILNTKCGSCHNNSKRKGGLSMHTLAATLIGGKHGVIINSGNAMGSVLMKRVSLDPKDEKFMPADNKPPLSEKEKKLIKWWIDHEAETVGKTVGQLNISTDIKNDFASLLKVEKNSEIFVDSNAINSINYVTNLKLSAVSETAVIKLKQVGFRVKYIHLKPVLLDISLPENNSVLPSVTSERLNALLAVKNNVLWLNVAGNALGDKQLDTISACKNLQRLRLDNNPVTDNGINRLQGLQNLESINLSKTNVTRQSLQVLSKMQKLAHIYVWQTGIAQQDIALADSTGLRFIAGAAAP